ncbi:response regulator transcription factor [Thermus oshimai]|uniref:response regulator transcription factor n=1 Tax=Thermus oshimai TaxID=56957 RepID=UPI000476CB4D|nr:response regulator transcription factor [Thermus oshimai]
MAKVLVVEDDPVVARVLEIALKRAGHEVHLVSDFPLAKKALDQAWDAIVLDLNLPGGFGLDLLRHLRQELGRRTPVFVLSGLKQEKTLLEALRLGAQDYLAKPFSPNELLLRLERYVAQG